MKVPFAFRLRINPYVAAIAAMFAAKPREDNDRLPERKHQKSPKRSRNPQRKPWTFGKQERKRRERIRRMNPTRKH